MNPSSQYLNTIRVPARMTAGPTAAWLGVQEHDIPVLVAAGLLKPLGNPAPNAPKYFSSAELEELVRDRAWLDKITKAISRHWKTMNQNKRHKISERVAIPNLQEND